MPNTKLWTFAILGILLYSMMGCSPEPSPTRPIPQPPTAAEVLSKQMLVDDGFINSGGEIVNPYRINASAIYLNRAKYLLDTARSQESYDKDRNASADLFNSYLPYRQLLVEKQLWNDLKRYEQKIQWLFRLDVENKFKFWIVDDYKVDDGNDGNLENIIPLQKPMPDDLKYLTAALLVESFGHRLDEAVPATSLLEGWLLHPTTFSNVPGKYELPSLRIYTKMPPPGYTKSAGTFHPNINTFTTLNVWLMSHSQEGRDQVLTHEATHFFHFRALDIANFRNGMASWTTDQVAEFKEHLKAVTEQFNKQEFSDYAKLWVRYAVENPNGEFIARTTELFFAKPEILQECKPVQFGSKNRNILDFYIEAYHIPEIYAKAIRNKAATNKPSMVNRVVELFENLQY